MRASFPRDRQQSFIETISRDVVRVLREVAVELIEGETKVYRRVNIVSGPGLKVLKSRTWSSTPSKRSMGIIAGTSDSPTSNAALRGRWKITVRMPARESC